MLKGVVSVEPGYAGGTVPRPTYEQVSGGKTGHAEVIKIEFDPTQCTFETLLTVFFASHDPSTLNRQGNDVGTQYRSIILYTTPEQKQVAEKVIAEINTSNPAGEPVVTEVVPFTEFFPAENYHQKYYESHKNAPYCQVIINPKVEKIQKKFANLLKQYE